MRRAFDQKPLYEDDNLMPVYNAFTRQRKRQSLHLTKQQFEVIRGYVDTYHEDINRVLRKDIRMSENANFVEISTDHLANVWRDIAVMDSAFESAGDVFEQDAVVYRGLGRIGPLQFGDADRSAFEISERNYRDKFVPGTVVVDKGFVSTSARKEAAASFGGAFAEIRVKKGQRALLGSSGEYEFILPRNTKFRVISQEGVPAGQFAGLPQEHWRGYDKVLHIVLEVVDD
jgi:hypothetical protein